MSKNLSEETPGKVVAAQGYGMRQLFRRPSPISPVTFPWAMLRDGATTVPFNATAHPVAFYVATKNYDPDDDYFSWGTTDGGDTGNDRFQLTLKKEGIYLIDCVVTWNDTGTGDGTARLALNPSSTYNPFGYSNESPLAQYGSDWQSTGASGDIQASGIQRVCMILSANTNCLLNPTVTLSLASGDRGLEGAYLKAIYLQAHGDTADWTVEDITP